MLAGVSSGAMVMPLEGEGGMFSGATLRAHMRDPQDRHEPRSRLVTIEQSSNLGGGRVWTLAQIEELAGGARAPDPPVEDDDEHDGDEIHEHEEHEH